MKNKIAVLFMAVCVIASGISFVFAEDGTEDITSVDSMFMSDYSVDTSISNDSFNPGEFCIELAMNAVDWLGVSNKSSKITIKTGAKAFKISERLPNLKTFIASNELAKASITGNTFNCKNTPSISWDETTGEWTTVIDAPVNNIRSALDTLISDNYIGVEDSFLRESQTDSDGDDPRKSFYDNYLYITAGTSLQYGDTKITFEKDCDIDELYDGINQANHYEDTFAQNIFKIQNSISTSNADENKILLSLAPGTYLQICEKRFTVGKEAKIEIEGAVDNGNDPLSSVVAAINTAEQTNELYEDAFGYTSNNHSENAAAARRHDEHAPKIYYITTCDTDAVFDSALELVNELLGVLSQKDAKLSIIPASGDVEFAAENRTPDPDASIAAEINVSSTLYPCTHENTEVRDAFKPTVTTVGYSGDVYCKDCGLKISEGELLPKLPSSIKLNYTSLKLKVKQSTSAVKVTFVKGDSIKSVTTSNSSIVKAAKSGSTGIKLTAGSKTGKATVTVKLASQKSAKITVTVQKSEVACTGIKVTSGTSVSIKKGKTHQIKVTRSPVTCVQKVTYKTSNKKVATVSSSGKVKGVKKGTAKITIKCGKKSKTIKITVK